MDANREIQHDCASPSSTSRGNGPKSRTLKSSPPKIAEQLAYEIESLIVARNWPVGQVLGSEAELLERFGVSRAVLREAIRIVEHHRAARMRRGPNGGLVVTAPDSRSIQRPITLYLDYARVSTRELFTVRRALELTSVELVTGKLNRFDIHRLRQTLKHEAEYGQDSMRVGVPYDLHSLIAELSGNAALSLFVDTLAKLGYDRTHDLTMPASDLEAQRRAHELIVEAMIDGDTTLAVRRMSSHLDAAAAHYPA